MSRRPWFFALVLVFILPCGGLLNAQSKAKAQNVPEIPYDSVPNFLKLPDKIYLGEGIGVATNSEGTCLRLYAKRRYATV